MSECVAVRCLVSGRVQGVFFRASTQTEALRLGLTGWVRNLPDGRVELLACGRTDALAALREWLHRGPPRAVVTRVDCTPAEDAGCSSFEIR